MVILLELMVCRIPHHPHLPAKCLVWDQNPDFIRITAYQTHSHVVRQTDKWWLQF